LGLASVERTPSAVELFIDGPHLAAQRYEVGDVTLAPERSRNAELSIAYQRGAVFSKFTVFNNQIDDYIYLRDSTEMDHDDEHDHGSLILGNYVQADARFTGFDRQNRTAQNELATAGYESLNMSLSTTLDLGSVAVQATLFGRNLLDDIARRHTSFVKEQAPLPGRNIGLKLTLKR
jgi:outer membrane receptor protein involved in Fe transport